MARQWTGKTTTETWCTTLDNVRETRGHTRSIKLFLSHLLFQLRCGSALHHTANKIRMLSEPHPAGTLCVSVWNLDLIIENSCKRNDTENSSVCGSEGEEKLPE